MTDPDKTPVLILSAGLSSRMKAFKPLLPLRESTVIENVICNVKAAGLNKIIVVVGYRADMLKPVLNKMAVDWIVNPAYRDEMYSSIRAGVDRIEQTAKAFFLLPCDMPFVHPQTFKILNKAFNPAKMDILKPRYHGKSGHPVLISAQKIPAIQSFSETGGLRALILKQAWKVADIDCNDPGMLIDLDNPRDYQVHSKTYNSA